MAKISVIVPVYKVEPYLRRCVDSILAQTFRDFELILVDDGSPDNCGAICDEYAQRDMRVHVIHQSNGGLSAARNAGLDWMFANSSNEYVAFIDSDDWVSENYFEELLKGVSISDGVACISWKRDKSDNGMGNAVKWNVISAEEFWEKEEGVVVTAWGKLLKKELFSDIRFPVGRINEDMFTTYKVIDKIDKVAFSDNALYNYFLRDDSIMARWDSLPKDRIDGYLEEIKYFDSRYFLVAARAYRLKLAYVCAHSLGHLPKADVSLRRYCRGVLRQMMDESRMRFIDSKRCAFLAYPVRARIAWPFVRLFDIMRRRGMVGAVRQYLRRFKHC